MDKNHRPLSDWERAQWGLIVAQCCRVGGPIELPIGFKAVIVAVDRELAELEARHGRLTTDA